MGSLAKVLIVVGAVLIALGVAMLFLDKIPGFRPGRLPGDIVIQRGNWRFAFPLATSLLLSILLSLLLTVLLWIFTRR